MYLTDAKKKGIFTYLFRLFLGAFDKIFTNKFFFDFALLFQKKLRGYDVVIAYHHEDSVKAVVSGFYRFAYKKTDAPIKLGWIHYDPYMVGFDDCKNEKYMEKMTKIICVSKGTADVFAKRHPNLKVPIDYCYNMHDIERILEFSKEKIDIEIQTDKFNCFSACRFGPQKAMPRAIRALTPVLKEHTDVRWYIAGDGEDMVEAVSVHNVKSGEKKKLDVNGVFLAVGTKPNSELFANLVKLTESGWIEAGESCRTSCPGIYAVGDVRTKQLRQVITAAADGANAITSIEHYLAEM